MGNYLAGYEVLEISKEEFYKYTKNKKFLKAGNYDISLPKGSRYAIIEEEFTQYENGDETGSILIMFSKKGKYYSAYYGY